MTAKKPLSAWKFQTIHESKMGEFRDIPMSNGDYKISADGVVVSRKHRGLPDGFWVLLSVMKSRAAKPYNKVTIQRDGDDKATPYQLSRLILEAWVGPPPTAKHCAAHIDGITDNDTLDNLVWSVAQDITYGRIVRGTWAHGESAGAARFEAEQIMAARKIVHDFNVPVNLLATALGMNQVRVREWFTKTWDATKWDGLKNPLEDQRVLEQCECDSNA